MSYGWEGEKVRLVPLDKEKHFDNAMAWMNDPEITRWLLGGDLPITRLQEDAWFDRMMEAGGADFVYAIETLESEHVGFSGFHKIDWRNGTAETGITIAPPGNWRKGYGIDAIRVRTRIAFEVLGLRLLISETMVGNDASIRTLKKAGYTESGRVPGRYWKRGAYRDVILFHLEKTNAK